MKKTNKIVTISALDHQGRGIAKEEKIIFIPNTLPQEIVEISIYKEKKNIAFATPVKWITTSPERTISRCPYFMQCGGCDTRHIMYTKELEFKQKKIEEILRKFASYEGPVQPIIPSPLEEQYRNKITFHVINRKVSLLKKESNEGIPISCCLLGTPKINTIIKMLSTYNLKDITSIAIRNSIYTNETMVIIETEKETIPIPSLEKEVTSIVLKNKSGYHTIYGKDTIIEKLNQLSFHISPDSFFQVNTKQAEILYQTIKNISDIHPEDKILDLYCGTGTIGIYLSKFAQEVVGIEINPHAIENANANKKLNQTPNVTFYCGDVGTILSKHPLNPDLVIIDPPRAGLNEQAMQEIKKLKPKKITYVSCDPVTLARDLKQFQENYEIKKVIPVDMFPKTYHVECVAVLKLK